MMLTKIVGERVYDFSHVVGGRDQVMGPLAIAFGRDNEMYAIVSALGGGRGITKYTVGLYPGRGRDGPAHQRVRRSSRSTDVDLGNRAGLGLQHLRHRRHDRSDISVLRERRIPPLVRLIR